jgi:protein ImuB
VLAIHLKAEPVRPRVEQHGLFVPLTPEPRQMEITLARLTALVGEGRVGTAEMQDAHRPDAFQMIRFTPNLKTPPAEAQGSVSPALRRFRPPWHAQVQLRNGRPARLSTLQMQGHVEQCAGPWNTSGEWWKPSAWDHDEWDVALSTGGIYRIYCDRQTKRWFVEGSYD